MIDRVSDAELLAQLGVTVEAPRKASRTPREERIIAGFEEITRFVAQHGREPQYGDDRDIFERLYAVRLQRLRDQPDCRVLLAEHDPTELLRGGTKVPSLGGGLDDAALLAELGVAVPSTSEITTLRHVKPREEVRAAEEIAIRTPCVDFDAFRPLFAGVRADLDHGVRETRPFERMAEIQQGEFFIVGGQIAYVAEKYEEFVTQYDRRDSRLRVIYDNGTESGVLLRSLQRALYRDEAGRRISDPAAGPLFGSHSDDQDLESGTIYVLRSKSDHPTVAEHRDLIHKIGVTGGKVETRIANAAADATYLLADVDVVSTYRLFNINRSKLEALLHRIFARACLDLTVQDRFGHPVKPREWFLAPLQVIDEVVERIKDRSITDFEYDPSSASLKRIKPAA